MTACRLIVCFDGTWNTPDQGGNPTNVVKTVRAIPSDGGDRSQITFYDKGVGTGGLADRILGGASGHGLTENVIDGYRFLANNYEPDDELYIFGFSRGAYTARSLAGLIQFAGLLSPLHLGQDLQAVIDLYRDTALDDETRSEKLAALDKEIKRVVSVPIECVGVWDTVGSLGIPGDLGRRIIADKYYFHDVQLGPNVRIALHAIGIDEKRAQFPPTLWVRKKDQPPVPDQVVEQAWFPGVHSNIGGSYEDAGLSDTALDWMLKRVRKLTGLRFDDAYIERFVHPDALARGMESRSAMYSGSKVFPYQRLIMQEIPEGRGIGEWFRRTFKRYDRRSVIPEDTVVLGERLHVAALKRWGQLVEHGCKDQGGSCEKREYRPANLKAVIDKAASGGAVPVCGDDGELLAPADVSWPES
jgi:uncharacterized protein (DUF2235 family)